MEWLYSFAFFKLSCESRSIVALITTRCLQTENFFTLFPKFFSSRVGRFVREYSRTLA